MYLLGQFSFKNVTSKSDQMCRMENTANKRKSKTCEHLVKLLKSAFYKIISLEQIQDEWWVIMN